VNPRMIDALADCHLREVRRQAAQYRIRRPRPQPLGGPDRRERLRSRAGFMLVEAGFHLLAAAESTSRGSMRRGSTPRG